MAASGGSGGNGPVDPGTLTRLMRRAWSGDAGAEDAFYDVVYSELLHRARCCIRRNQACESMDPMDLVSELYLRLRESNTRWNDRRHFFGFAARAMRSIVVDHARSRSRRKRSARGGRVPLDGLVAEFEHRGADLIALDEALERLHANDEREARIVELRFFAGLGLAEISDVLDVPLRTVERDWSHAKLWLRRTLR